MVKSFITLAPGFVLLTEFCPWLLYSLLIYTTALPASFKLGWTVGRGTNILALSNLLGHFVIESLMAIIKANKKLFLLLQNNQGNHKYVYGGGINQTSYENLTVKFTMELLLLKIGNFLCLNLTFGLK
jgi:hypothetical protein